MANPRTGRICPKCHAHILKVRSRKIYSCNCVSWSHIMCCERASGIENKVTTSLQCCKYIQHRHWAVYRSHSIGCNKNKCHIATKDCRIGPWWTLFLVLLQQLHSGVDWVAPDYSCNNVVTHVLGGTTFQSPRTVSPKCALGICVESLCKSICSKVKGSGRQKQNAPRGQLKI